MGIHFTGIDSYNNGLTTWNGNSIPFFVGVCPWGENGNLYYLKGNVYACRLYEQAISLSEVKENYNKTLQYRESF